MGRKPLGVGAYDAAKFVGHMRNRDVGGHEPDRHIQGSISCFPRSGREYCSEPSLKFACSFGSFSADRDEIGDAFQAQHPGIGVELLMEQRVLDLSKGEADIAIRGGRRDRARWWAGRSRKPNGASTPAAPLSNDTAAPQRLMTSGASR